MLEEGLGVQAADDAEGGAVARGGERARVTVGEDRDLAGGGGEVVLLLQPGGAVGADRGVVLEVLGEDGLGGLDVRVEDGVLGFGVGEALELGGAGGQFEEGDGVGEVDGGGTALFEKV